MCGESQWLPGQDSMNRDMERNAANQEASVNKNKHVHVATRISSTVFCFYFENSTKIPSSSVSSSMLLFPLLLWYFLVFHVITQDFWPGGQDSRRVVCQCLIFIFMSGVSNTNKHKSKSLIVDRVSVMWLLQEMTSEVRERAHLKQLVFLYQR